MMSFLHVDDIAMALAVIAFMAGTLWLIWFASRGRLMRCPESGAVGLVDVDPTVDGETARLNVRQCDLWPARQNCARGCLARYSGHSEMALWYRVPLEALRPFEGPGTLRR